MWRGLLRIKWSMAAMAPLGIARGFGGPLDRCRSLLGRRRASPQTCSSSRGRGSSSIESTACWGESASESASAENDDERTTRGAVVSYKVSRRRLGASLMCVSTAAVFSCPGVATADVIYDPGAKLRGKVLSTRDGEEGGDKAESPEAASIMGSNSETSRVVPSSSSSVDLVGATMVVPERWKVKSEPVVDTSDLRLPSSSSVVSESGSRYTWSNFRDPITGGQTIESISVEILPAPQGASDPSYLDRVYKAGTIESITASLPSDAKLAKADIFRANTRQDDKGITYYDWELAATPETCSEEERRILGVCPYENITLLSAAFVKGKLVTMSIDSSVENFQKYEKDIRNTLKTFSVTNYQEDQ